MERRMAPARWARTVMSSLALDAQAIGRPGYSVLLGRCLLFVTGVVVSVPMPLLHLSASQTFVVVRLTAAMIAVLLISFKVPWGRLPRTAVLAFPISVMAGLAAWGTSRARRSAAVSPVCSCSASATSASAARRARVLGPAGGPAGVRRDGRHVEHQRRHPAGDRCGRLDPAGRAARPPDGPAAGHHGRPRAGVAHRQPHPAGQPAGLRRRGWPVGSGTPS